VFLHITVPCFSFICFFFPFIFPSAFFLFLLALHLLLQQQQQQELRAAAALVLELLAVLSFLTMDEDGESSYE
jgi:hypothetical protein